MGLFPLNKIISIRKYQYFFTCFLNETFLAIFRYGHISPATQDGMMFCILYSIIAIMTFVAMLANVSSGIVNGIVYTYRFPPEYIIRKNECIFLKFIIF